LVAQKAKSTFKKEWVERKEVDLQGHIGGCWGDFKLQRVIPVTTALCCFIGKVPCLFGNHTIYLCHRILMAQQDGLVVSNAAT
jgi:hypothetical protein